MSELGRQYFVTPPELCDFNNLPLDELLELYKLQDDKANSSDPLAFREGKDISNIFDPTMNGRCTQNQAMVDTQTSSSQYPPQVTPLSLPVDPNLLFVETSSAVSVEYPLSPAIPRVIPKTVPLSATSPTSPTTSNSSARSRDKASLERNRIAASKSRAKKKNYIAGLQAKEVQEESRRKSLDEEWAQLQSEVANLEISCAAHIASGCLEIARPFYTTLSTIKNIRRSIDSDGHDSVVSVEDNGEEDITILDDEPTYLSGLSDFLRINGHSE